MSKPKMKTVIAEVREYTEYFAHTVCPYCKVYNDSEVEIDNITIMETCFGCNKKYKVKIPKDSL